TGLTIIYIRFCRPPFKALMIADALGLSFFTIAGAQIAERGSYPAITIVIMGVMTGVAGGVVRDVLLVEIPAILRRTKIYATAAVVGSLVYVYLQNWGLAAPAAALMGMGTIAAIRFAAIVWGLTLPTLQLLRDFEKDG
ncbi:hypothetical protein C7293_30240, partial [filamentous cyanobacterium CCT1]